MRHICDNNLPSKTTNNKQHLDTVSVAATAETMSAQEWRHTPRGVFQSNEMLGMASSGPPMYTASENMMFEDSDMSESIDIGTLAQGNYDHDICRAPA